jgi:hypothetical protein
MNPQIEKLAEQAGFEEKDGHISIQGVYMFNTTRMEKFAELIVSECARRSKELGQPELGQGLMKHFGVEE